MLCSHVFIHVINSIILLCWGFLQSFTTTTKTCLLLTKVIYIHRVQLENNEKIHNVAYTNTTTIASIIAPWVLTWATSFLGSLFVIINLLVCGLKVRVYRPDINLSFDGVLKTPIFFIGGGGWIYPLPIFICENNIKGSKIMHCVDFFFWVVVLKIWAFLHVFLYLSLWVDITPHPLNQN